MTRGRAVGLRIAVLLAISCGLLAPAAEAAPGDIVALGVGANANTIYRFSRDKPSVVASTAVTGVTPGSVLVGIAYRPATLGLYGLGVDGNTASLFTIDAATGAAALVGSDTVSTIAGATAYGIAFNPVSDRLRVVNDLASDGSGQNVNNFRIGPTGKLAGSDSDLDFNALPGGITNQPEVAVAYDRNAAGGSATTLFGIVAGGDRLVIQGSANGAPTSPNTGILANVGLLGIDTGNNAGLDIDPVTGDAYAVLEASGVSGLYRIDLATGVATLVGKIGEGTVDFGALSIEPPAPPPPVQPTVPPAQTLDSLTVSPFSFRAAKKGKAVLSKKKPPVGAKVGYRLPVAATVSFTVERSTKGRKVGKKCVKQTRVNRGRKPCALTKALKGGFSHTGAAGQNSFTFTGRIDNRALSPGSYNLVGTVGASVRRARFKIVP